MASMSIKMDYQFTLTAAETALMFRALSGRLKDEQDIANAKALGDNLARMKAGHVSSIIDSNEKLINNLERKGSNEE